MVKPALALVIPALLLAGCTATAPSTQGTAPAGSVAERNGLGGLTVEKIVERLDASADDRANGPKGSVRSHELILTDERTQEKQTIAMPKDRFYLAIAPYTQETHECFNHNLATCQGEMRERTVHVTITDAKGASVVDRDVMTMGNGFAGLWLPRDLKGTMTVSAEGKRVTVPVSTGADDPTCLTTPLKLI